jgi:hypothetical protein
MLKSNFLMASSSSTVIKTAPVTDLPSELAILESYKMRFMLKNKTERDRIRVLGNTIRCFLSLRDTTTKSEIATRGEAPNSKVFFFGYVDT